MKRPVGLTVIGWLAIIGGALQVLGSLGLVGIGALNVFIGSTGAIEATILLGLEYTVWTGIVLIALGVLGLVLGFGVLNVRPWAWVMGIVLYALNFLAALALLYVTGVGATVVYVAILSAVILGYLLMPSTHHAFGHEPSVPISGQTPHAV